jgi:hypothetical protein
VVLHQYLVFAGLRDVAFLEAEVAFLDPGRGAAGEDDALVLFHGGFLAGAGSGLKVGAGDTAIFCLFLDAAQLEGAQRLGDQFAAGVEGLALAEIERVAAAQHLALGDDAALGRSAGS